MSGYDTQILGDEIYAYVPDSAREFYGGDIIDKIAKKCRYKINVIRSSSQLSKEELKNTYKRCFCGLRLTPHDGIANTVMELGLMGRMCIYNGEVPNAIKWVDGDIDGIVDNINKESCRIGCTNDDLSQKMKKFLDVGSDWLSTSFYKDI
jgi:hypothetical protein